MDLYKDILMQILHAPGNLNVSFEGIKIENPNEAVENVCYQTIMQIKSILDDDTLDDFECIEAIVKLLEEIASDGGSRRDFG